MSLYELLAKSHPSIERGKVWCKSCDLASIVNPAHCLQHGWPKCCGETMTIDSPQKRAAMAKASAKSKNAQEET